MNKKTLVSCFLSLALLGGGTVVYSSLSSAQEVVGGEKAQSSKLDVSLEKGKAPAHSSNVKNGEINSSKENTVSSTPSSQEQQVSKPELERKAFATQAVKQDFYLEKVDANGSLTYEKATDEKVKELMDSTSSNKGSIYQVQYNGKLISVLSTVD